MTDINPQWRLQAITEAFGQCGIGWYYTIEKMWTESGAGGELMAFVHVHLFTTNPQGGWSQPIVGIGGSALVAKESAGLRANDEAYKMALTDALSVAMKQLGFAADIYAGKFDGSKYKDDVPPTKPELKSVQLSDFSEEEQTFLKDTAMEIIALVAEGNEKAAFELTVKLDNDEKLALWTLLDSKSRTSLKKSAQQTKEN